jgi:hypothetical protein
MIDKPDPAKDAGRTDPTGTKRPHATLDLKATEVKTPPPQTPAASAAASSSTEKAAGSSAGAASMSTSAAGKTTGASDASAKTSPPNAAPTPKPQPAASPDATPAQDSRGGGFFSHLLAGIVGGALVYVGAALLGDSHDRTSELAARLSALEAAPKDGADVAALTSRLGEAESRLASLDELNRTIASLREAQDALQAETKSLAERAQGGDGASAERLAKLEERLQMIASGAGANGSVPELAAVTGKIADVESSFAAQIAELRKSLPAETDQRLAAVQEASEAAKIATARLDRELSQVRTELARSTQKDEAVKAETDRLAAAVAAAREETGRLASAFGELRSAVDSQLKSVAKPADVTAAVNPVNSKIAELEQNVQSVVRNEQSRRQNAERIVLSLELSNLKRALDRGQGQGYAAELEAVRTAAGGQLDLSALERFKDTGVATPAQLKAEFRPLINAVIDADLEPADGSVIDRLLAGAKSVVRVRRVSHDATDTSTEAIVSRIETALDEGRLGDVLAQAKLLPQRARVPIEDWLIKVTARDTVDQAIAAVDARLKASLAGAPEADTSVAPPATPPPQQN